MSPGHAKRVLRRHPKRSLVGLGLFVTAALAVGTVTTVAQGAAGAQTSGSLATHSVDGCWTSGVPAGSISALLNETGVGHILAQLPGALGSPQGLAPKLDLGPVFAGFALSDSSLLCNHALPGGVRSTPFSSVIYGTCDASSAAEGGCGEPLEIQSWPQRARNLSSYKLSPDDPAAAIAPGQSTPAYPYQFVSLSELAKLPVASFDGGTRLEIYTGTATVVIFANDAAIAERAARTLATQLAQPDRAPAIAQLSASVLMAAATGDASALTTIEQTR